MAIQRKRKTKVKYPRIEQLGLRIVKKPFPHIPGKMLGKALEKNEISLSEFNKFFGIQTSLRLDDGDAGLYPWDVEAVLERIISGKLEGTQLFWD